MSDSQWFAVLRSKTHLGLHQPARHNEHAGLHWGGDDEVPTPPPNRTTTLPLQSNNHPLRRESSEGGRRQISPPHAGPNQTRAENCGHSPLLRASGRFHPPHCAQCNRGPAVKRHPRCSGSMPPTPAFTNVYSKVQVFVVQPFLCFVFTDRKLS